MSRVTSSHSDYIAPISCVIIEIGIARPPPPHAITPVPYPILVLHRFSLLSVKLTGITKIERRETPGEFLEEVLK